MSKKDVTFEFQKSKSDSDVANGSLTLVSVILNPDLRNVTEDDKEEDGDDTFHKKYVIVGQIGTGAYSKVFKCKDRETGQFFACKRLNEKLKSVQKLAQMPEVVAARTVRAHPNIQKLLEKHFTESIGQASLIYDLMDEDLYGLISRRKNLSSSLCLLLNPYTSNQGRTCRRVIYAYYSRLLPESRVKSIMYQILSALEHLHKHGIFHCDVKPENILVKRPNDLVKLGDFGNIKRIKKASRLPYSQDYIATRWYRAPETILTMGFYSFKIDIWAAGCVFYELLTLQPMFSGQNEIDQLEKIHHSIGLPPPSVLQVFCDCAEKIRSKYGPTRELHQKFLTIDKILVEMTVAAREKNTNTNSDDSDWEPPKKDTSGWDCLMADCVNANAQRLLKHLLQYDPSWRPTAREALNQVYFKTKAHLKSELTEAMVKNKVL